jgi:hypothetical protein
MKNTKVKVVNKVNKRPKSKIVKPTFRKSRKSFKRVRKTMANTEQKPTEKPSEKPEQTSGPTQFGHKNPPIGPTTTKPLMDWRKDRDYEQFNPTAEK